MGLFYTPPATVVDGDVAYASDVNDINTAAGAAFTAVEEAFADVPDTVSYYSDLAEDWAEKAEDSQVEVGKYSAKHHAAKSAASASTASGHASAASGSASAASASASTASGHASAASGSASAASASASTASGHASTATTQAGIATTKASLAADYANKAENSQVETGTYSAYHWSKKAEAFGGLAVVSVTGTGVNNTDPRNPVLSIGKTQVGLGNVDNTSDANKPVSSAMLSELNLKANLASPTFTGTPVAPNAAAGTNNTQIATTSFVAENFQRLPAASYLYTPGGDINGLHAYCLTGNTVYVRPGACVDSTGKKVLFTSSDLSISIPVSSDYPCYIFLVYTTGGVTELRYYLNYNGATGDINVSYYRFITFAKNNSSGVVFPFYQWGNELHYIDAAQRPIIASSTTTSYAAKTMWYQVPSQHSDQNTALTSSITLYATGSAAASLYVSVNSTLDFLRVYIPSAGPGVSFTVPYLYDLYFKTSTGTAVVKVQSLTLMR